MKLTEDTLQHRVGINRYSSALGWSNTRKKSKTPFFGRGGNIMHPLPATTSDSAAPPIKHMSQGEGDAST
ncbi:MAG: hypothetical protein OXF84_05350 [Bacteroidetes bacterium]|nr:hypothetical protein [Bacteroidota bacterium]